MACYADDPAVPESVFKQALDRILEDHATARWLHRAFQGISEKDHDSVSKWFREVIKRNPHRDVQGAACYYLADRLCRNQKFDEAEVVSLLNRCAGEFKDVSLEIEYEGQEYEYTLADLAKPRITELASARRQKGTRHRRPRRRRQDVQAERLPRQSRGTRFLR